MTTDTRKAIKATISAYPKQMEFIKDKAPELAFIAGLGSGKSYAGAVKALKFNMENPGAWGICTAPQFKILEIATIPTYEKVFPPEFVTNKRIRPHAEWELANGGRIFFWSTDKPETIAGAELAWGHMDEGSLSPYQAYINVKKRLRQRYSDGKPYPYQLWVTTTPRQLNWLYHAIMKEGASMKMYNASTLDNIYLGNRADYVASLGLTGKAYEQEVEGNFVLLTGDCLFDTTILQTRLDDALPFLRTTEDGMCGIWKEPVVGAVYVAAADCADEGGGGVNDLIILDAQTGEEMAELNADISADEFSYRCRRVLAEFNDPIFAPERNGTVGGIVVTKFQEMGYPHLYKDHLNKYGWYTTTTGEPPRVNRFTMLKEYEEAVRKRSTIIHSSEAISEMSTLVRNEGDVYKPREGCKSDRVMSRAIAWQIRKFAQVSKSIGFTSTKRIYTTY